MDSVPNRWRFSEADTALLDVGRMLKSAGYRFTTVTPLTQARVNRRPGNDLATDLAGIFGWSRPFEAETLPTAIMSSMHDAGILVQSDLGWRSAVRLSCLGPQYFFHSAYPTLSADAVFFGPDTVRFARAIELVLPTLSTKSGRAVDIGCGAGPGGIVIAKASPDAEVLMVDINEEALRLARINAALNETPNAEALRSDLLSATTGQFDLIVSNPPYLIDPGQRAYRHGGGALGEGLSLSILESALSRLSVGGTLVLYTGSAIVNGRDGFRDAVEARLAQTGHRWSYAEMDPDVFGEELEDGAYARADRIAAVVLTVTKGD